MKRKSLFFALSTILLFASCIKELNLPIAEVPPKVVVNSLFSPDSILQVHVGLSNSKPMNNTQIVEEPNYLEDAVVLLYKDDIFLEQLTHSEKGWYVSTHLPEEEAKYKIEVTVDGFDMVWAESRVPRYPDMTQPAECRLVGPMVIAGEQFIVQDTYLFFKDELGADFYGFYFGGLGFITDYYSTGVNFDRITDQSLLSDADIDFVSKSTLFISSINFTDRLFEGQNKTLHLPNLSYGLEIPAGYDVGFGLLFGSVSKEFFDYFKALYRHLHNSNTANHIDDPSNPSQTIDPITLLFMGAPVQAYTNINGGLGVFAGYNYKVVEVFYVD